MKYYSHLFLVWEAVRCCRTIESVDNQACLMSPNQWILELLLPWCKYCDFSNIHENIVSAEVFRFLLDMSFLPHGKYFEQVRACWTQVAKSPSFGKTNTVVLLEVLLTICGRIEQYRDQTLSLASCL